MPIVHLSTTEARHIALAAQGFAERPARSARGINHLRSVTARLHALQIDPISAVVRSQYMPAFSRLGPYPAGALDQLAYGRRELFEYIGHRASLLPVALHPLMRWRMEAFKKHRRWISGIPRRYVQAVLDEVAERGPLASDELTDRGKRRNEFWAPSSGKEVLSWLNACGRVAVAGRRGVRQLYDLPERVIPREVLDTPPPSTDDAKRELLMLAAGAIGVGTAGDIADYFSMQNGMPRVRRLLADLVEDGRLAAAEVEGWRHPAYLHPLAKVPGEVKGRALLSPFDSLIWERSRTARLFGFHYRIEIYVPAAKRQYGYYVLPFLLGESLVARVDLRADQKRSALVVPGAFGELGHDGQQVARELGHELRRMAEWLGLERVEVGDRGNLAKDLASVL